MKNVIIEFLLWKEFCHHIKVAAKKQTTSFYDLCQFTNCTLNRMTTKQSQEGVISNWLLFINRE